MSERSERIMSTGFVRRPGAEQVIGAPRLDVGHAPEKTRVVHQ